MNSSASDAWKKVPEEKVVEFQRIQHAVKRWIEQILHIELSDENLHGPLKNGVVLCYLMKKLDPSLIPRIQEGTSVDQTFRLKENIDFFVAACAELGVLPYKLFRTNDLWLDANIVNVVDCLADLALIVENDFEGAPVFELDSEWQPPKLTTEETNKLKKLLIKRKDKPNTGQQHKIAVNIVIKKLKLLAGNGVDINAYVPAFVKFQSIVRGFQQRQKYKTQVRNVAYRDHVAAEILSTEKFYVESLKHCITVWVQPLERMSKPIVTEKEMRDIFSELQAIYAFNSTLLASIEEVVSGWHTTSCLGGVFLQIMHYLKLYKTYVQNFSNAMAVIERLERKKDVAAYFEECKKHPAGGNLDLASFLIMPVQRIPRYNLLLTDLVKHTWPEHPDYKDLMQATEEICKIADQINESKREAELMSKVLDFAKSLTGKHELCLIERGRRLIKEAAFNKGTKDEINLFLFNDLFVAAKPEKRIIGGKKYAYKESAKLAAITLQESPKGGNHFEVHKLGGKGKPLLKLEASSPKEKQDWFEVVNALKSESKQHEALKRDLTRPQLTAEEMLTMSSVVKEWHEKMDGLKGQKEELQRKIQSLNDDLSGKGPKKKKPSKKEKEEIDKELFSLNQELDVVEAKIVEMGEPPSNAQLKRKDKTKEYEAPSNSSSGGQSHLDYRRSALMGYGDRNAALALINHADKRFSSPDSAGGIDKRRLNTPPPHSARPQSVATQPVTPKEAPSQQQPTPATPSTPSTTTTPSTPTTTTATTPTTQEGGSKKEGEPEKAEPEKTTPSPTTTAAPALSKKEEKAKKKEEEKQKKAAKKAEEKRKKETGGFVITRKD